MRRILVQLREFDLDEVELLCQRYREAEGLPERPPENGGAEPAKPAKKRGRKPKSSPTKPSDAGTGAKKSPRKKRAASGSRRKKPKQSS